MNDDCFLQISMGDGSSFHGRSSNNGTIPHYVRRCPAALENTSDEPSVSDSSSVSPHRSLNRS